MASGDETHEMLVSSDSDAPGLEVSSHVWPRFSQNRAFKMSAAFIVVSAACAALYAAVSRPSGTFLEAKDLDASVSLDGVDAIPSTFYLIKHTFKKEEDAGPWWKKAMKTLGDEDAKEKWVDSIAKKGFYNHLFLPTATGGPFYCLWEAKAGRAEDDMQKFIDSDDSPGKGMHNHVMPLPLELIGGVLPKGMEPFFGSRRLGAKKSSTTFYLIEHTFKEDDDVAPLWKKATTLLTDKDEMKKVVDNTADEGFYNHFFLPTAQDGPFFCLWEAKEGKTEDDMQKFIDSDHSLAKGMRNHVMPLPLKLLGGPPVEPYDAF